MKSMQVRLYFFAVCCALALPVFSDSLRCGTSLISLDTHKFEVLAKCGDPTAAEVRNECQTAFGGYPAHTFSLCREVEEWLYKRGAGNFFKIIKFVDGRVDEINDEWREN